MGHLETTKLFIIELPSLKDRQVNAVENRDEKGPIKKKAPD